MATPTVTSRPSRLPSADAAAPLDRSVGARIPILEERLATGCMRVVRSPGVRRAVPALLLQRERARRIVGWTGASP